MIRSLVYNLRTRWFYKWKLWHDILFKIHITWNSLIFPWHLPLFRISLTFFKIPWQFPDLEKIFFSWLFPDAWQPCMYNDCFPLRTVKSGYKTRKPWLSKGLKKSIERKNKLYHRKQKTKNPEHEIIYKKYHNKLNKLMSIVEREYHEHRLQENKQNLKASWRILKEILNKNKNNLSCSRFYINNTVCNDKKRIAESFNSFFVNVGPNLAKNIPSDSPSPTGYMERNPSSMAVIPVSQNEIITIIKNLKQSSPGWDDITSSFVWAPYACIKPVYHTRCFSAWTQSSESNPIIQIKRSNGILGLQTCIRTTSFFQKFWTPYVQPIVIVCKQMQITIWVSIRVPLRSFTWTGAHVSCG